MFSELFAPVSIGVRTIAKTVRILERNHAYNINLGLGYDLGSITPQFAYQYAWQDTQYKQHVFGLYAAAPVAGGVVKAGVKYLLGKRDKRFQRCNRRR